MKHKKLNFISLELPGALTNLLKLTPSGQLAISADGLTYLNVNDKYIHELFPLLNNHYPNMTKPDYFGDNQIGAHISVIYPEENIEINEEEDLGAEHHFKITGLFTADLNLKRYYVLGIESDSLYKLRKKYHLPEKLMFKDHLVDLHMTVGVGYLL